MSLSTRTRRCHENLSCCTFRFLLMVALQTLPKLSQRHRRPGKHSLIRPNRGHSHHLSRAKLVTAQTQTQPHLKPPSPQGPALKPTYSQALKAPTRPRDPGKPSRDPPTPSRARDQARDQTPDLSRDMSRVVSNTTRSRDQTRSPDLRITRTRTCRATRPLPHIWKTVGVKPREGIPQGIPHSLPKANLIGRY